MSKIEKLSIQGVRSFGPKRVMAIQFETPLTLIVGVNGSGKTTVIESLKYVTTGEMPPNAAKGASFIHDPEFDGEKEVLAKIQLLYTSVNHTRIVSTRNLQLTINSKGARSAKQLEGTIRMVKDGERGTMSSKTLELNGLMPRSLGVSKAILDYVIFCHQEESYWPLGQAKDLKDKFDQIFEALKYSKAIDNLKVLQKNKREELKTLKVMEDHAKLDNDKAIKSKGVRRKLEKDIQDLHSRKSELGQKLEEAKQKAEEFWEQAGKADHYVSELRGKRIARQTKDESVQSLRQNLNEMSDSDQELQQMLEEYEDRIGVFNAELDQKTAGYHEHTNQIQEARDQVNSKEREVGSYEAQKENFDRQVENRKRLVQETARSHGIRNYDLNVDDDKAKEFMEVISREAREQQAVFEQARSKAREKLQTQQKVLNGIYEQKSALNQSKNTARQAIQTYDNKIRGLQAQQDKIDLDEGGKATLESQLQETQTQLQQSRSDLNNSDWNAVIESTESDMRRLDDEKEKLDGLYAEAARRAGDSAQLDFVRKELKDRQRGLDTMKNAHNQKISTLLGNAWSPANAERDFQRVVEQKSAELSEAERQRNGTSQELDYNKSRIKERQNEVEAAQKDIKDAETTIKNALECTPDAYLEEMEQVERNRDELKADKEQLDKVRKFLESCISSAKNNKSCRICCKKVAPGHELEALTNNVTAQLQKYQIGQETEQNLKEIEQDLKNGKAARPAYETWEKLHNQVLPAKQAELKKLEQDHKRLTTQLEQQDYTFDEKKRAKSDVDAMARTIQNISKYVTEIANFEAQVKELQAKQDTAGSTSRGLDEIEGDLKKVNENLKILKARHGEALSNRDRVKARINSLELQASELKGKVSQAEYQLKEKKALQAQEEEYRGLVAEKREEIKTIDNKLDDLNQEQKTQQEHYDDITRQSADEDRELQDKANKLHSSVNKLKMADQEIQAYHDRGGDAQLKRGRQQIETAKSTLNDLLEKQRNLGREIKQLEDRNRDQNDTKRSIIDNQRFRRDLRQLEALNREIAELEGHNAEADKARYEQEAQTWQSKRNKYAAEEAGVSGQLKEIDSALAQAYQDWETDYKGAKDKYKAAHVMVETTKAAIDDLGRCAGALDKAIMKYHSLKMEEINRIIADLWRSTYQGTDVDTILIRSENETQKANKTYNYRVCMMKQDTEMDMRGRCSAGQKVLASIIIRLALAECFGNNCGVIALDEPTTNLDQDNIIALAKSLGEIIRQRRAQRNFQLIVITHDEEFLRAMNCSDFTDNYFRVYRDGEQKSVIVKQSISEIA
ncbi:hypothetical protein PRZ48_004993 [Zasmidium cellare]|uniref:Rad50/SbcC-type AAA domain-containing protein n=1 Tax=Zasmidium cellare TaxID=395010 RepID=A0ABR0ES99_ZASCE|nr:hypothetical protein PRZ48_004993 [Zasmidium cellare]